MFIDAQKLKILINRHIGRRYGRNDDVQCLRMRFLPIWIVVDCDEGDDFNLYSVFHFVSCSTDRVDIYTAQCLHSSSKRCFSSESAALNTSLRTVSQSVSASRYWQCRYFCWVRRRSAWLRSKSWCSHIAKGLLLPTTKSRGFLWRSGKKHEYNYCSRQRTYFRRHIDRCRSKSCLADSSFRLHWRIVYTRLGGRIQIGLRRQHGRQF